tara:strand:- start:880 stop:1041 length:162 start_codon:yes stop_codon:yes gene_type:complete
MILSSLFLVHYLFDIICITSLLNPSNKKFIIFDNFLLTIKFKKISLKISKVKE